VRGGSKFALGPWPPSLPSPREERGEGNGSTAWLDFKAAIRRIGHTGSSSSTTTKWCPSRALLARLSLADRLVTNGEWVLESLADGGASTPHTGCPTAGGGAVKARRTAQGYGKARRASGGRLTLNGLVPVDPAAPVCHAATSRPTVRALGRQRLPTASRVEGRKERGYKWMLSKLPTHLRGG